jgi:hypothetical protein
VTARTRSSGPSCKGGFCQQILAKCFVNTQFVANILFADEAGFTRNGIVNFNNAHVWVDDNPHATVASRHEHRFSINVWVGILGDELLGAAVLLIRLTGAVYHCFFGERFTSTLGTCACSSTTTHVVHARWGTTSFSPHCQTAPKPDFR